MPFSLNPAGGLRYLSGGVPSPGNTGLGSSVEQGARAGVDIILGGPDKPNDPVPTEQEQSVLDRWLPVFLTSANITTSAVGAAKASSASTRAADVQVEAAKYAADLTAQSADKATGLQRDIYEQTRRDLMPGLNVGNTAMFRLSDMMGLDRAGSRGFQPGALRSAADHYRFKPTPAPGPGTPAPQNLPPPGGYEPTLTPVNGQPGVFINEYGERVDQNGMPVDL